MTKAFQRTELLIGEKGIKTLQDSTVAVFGVGGVGSFVAEALARSGVGNIILVDKDSIDVTNINRQIHANTKTVGKDKVEVMKERILDINPSCNVTAYKKFYNRENSSELISEKYDYVVDAIDTVASKLDLAEICTNMGINIISSMGAGNKLDPTKFEVADIYKTSVCPLAKVMRHELRKRGIKKLKVVYSKEIPIKPDSSIEIPKEVGSSRRSTPGSVAFVPSVVGLIIASQVVRDLLKLK